MAVGHLAFHKTLKNCVPGEIVDGMRVDLPSDHHIRCRLVCESICFLLVFCIKSLEPCQVVKKKLVELFGLSDILSFGQNSGRFVNWFDILL